MNCGRCGAETSKLIIPKDGDDRLAGPCCFKAKRTNSANLHLSAGIKWNKKMTMMDKMRIKTTKIREGKNLKHERVPDPKYRPGPNRG